MYGGRICMIVGVVSLVFLNIFVLWSAVINNQSNSATFFTSFVERWKPKVSDSTTTRATSITTSSCHLAPSSIPLNSTILTPSNSNCEKCLYTDVLRKDGKYLYIAFYFPQFHFVPENVVNGSHYYDDWEVVRNANERSLTPVREYSPLNRTVLTMQDNLAHKYGIGVFSFYHYWLDDSLAMNAPVELYMSEKRKTKFMFCWDDTSGLMGKMSFKYPQKHAYQLMRYFTNENYLTDKYGRKPFHVYTTHDPKSGKVMPGLAEYLCEIKQFLKKLYGIEMYVGVGYQKWSDNWNIAPWADVMIEFGPHTNYYKTKYTIRDPKEAKNYWQGALTSWDNRPRSQSGRIRKGKAAINNYSNKTIELFAAEMNKIKKNIHAKNVDSVITLFAWNEWSEGAALEESEEYGSRFLDAL